MYKQTIGFSAHLLRQVLQDELNTAAALTLNRIKPPPGPVPHFPTVQHYDLWAWISKAGWFTVEALLRGDSPDSLTHYQQTELMLAMGAETMLRMDDQMYRLASEHQLAVVGGSIELRIPYTYSPGYVGPKAGLYRLVSTLDLWELRIACVRHGLGVRLGLVEA